MNHRQVARFGAKKPTSGSVVRHLILIFTVAIVLSVNVACTGFGEGAEFIFAPGGGPRRETLRPKAEEPSGPFASQIRKKERELDYAFIDLADANETENYSTAQGYERINACRDKVNTLKRELAVLKAKASQTVSSPSGGCFTADMWVLTEDGAKSIADIQVGDKVLSVDEAGIQVAADVLKTYKDQGYHYFLINQHIKVTALHRFFTDKGWKRTRDLKIGDRIMTRNNLFEEVFAFEWFGEDLYVYNLTISKNHNFFISPDGKRGYLVHNGGGGK